MMNERDGSPPAKGGEKSVSTFSPSTVVVGCDHAGLGLKRSLVEYLMGRGIALIDLGTEEAVSVDYPVYAHAVASRLAAMADPDAAGLLVCGTGTGMAMAANRHAGIRAVVCTEPLSAEMARRHNDANILCLGGRMVGSDMARRIADVFYTTPFEGGRHARRVSAIDDPAAAQLLSGSRR